MTINQDCVLSNRHILPIATALRIQNLFVGLNYILTMIKKNVLKPSTDQDDNYVLYQNGRVKEIFICVS